MGTTYLPETSELQHAPEPGAGYYASCVDGKRYGFLLGPFATHTEALDSVPIAKATAEAVNSRAFFYGFGTCKITSEPGAPELPVGVLNTLVGGYPCPTCGEPATITPAQMRLGQQCDLCAQRDSGG